MSLRIEPEHRIGRISPYLYGFLLEHLYHSVSNGLWGECVWNRSFEERHAVGQWTADTSGNLRVEAMSGRGTFYVGRGKDYVLAFDTRRTGGDGTLIIGIRDQHREQMLTNRVYIYLGAESHVEEATGWIWYSPNAKVNNVPIASFPWNGGWHHVEIECKGMRIAARLDGKEIYESEISDCPKDGDIMLGAAGCCAEFRNIRSTEGDFPLNVTRHWNMTGECQTAFDVSPLNHSSALIVSPKKNKTGGIEQKEKYYISGNDPLKGSVWLKGGSSSVIVQLTRNDSIISTQGINIASDDWREYSISLSSKDSLNDCSLRFISNSPFSIDQVSLMHQSSMDNDGFRCSLLELVNGIKPTMLRWPGGSFSEQYHFEDGIGKQHERKGIQRWDDFDPLSFGTDEFVELCRRVGAEPNIVVPIGYHNYDGYAPDRIEKTDWLQRALDWLEYCNGDTTTTWGRQRAINGHPEPYNVKYWEIDNEVWKMNPETYAALARIFSMAMKQKDPRVKIIGCGSGRLGAEGAGLDSIMIHTVGRYIDYISPHYYQTIDKYGPDGVEEYGRYLDRLAKWIQESENPEMRIYLSEWNLEKTDMRTGLFAGGFLNRLERSPYVEMAAPALFLRHTSATGWDNAFINFNQDKQYLAPNYVVMKLWRDHYLPNRISLNTIDDYWSDAIATCSDDGRIICLKLVNPTANAKPLRINDAKRLGNATWEIVSARDLKSRNTLENPDIIKKENRTVSYSEESLVVDIPPYSASVFTFVR